MQSKNVDAVVSSGRGRRGWWRWWLAVVVLTALAMVAQQVIRIHLARRSLAGMLEKLKQAGEPVVAQAFVEPAVPDDQNAVRDIIEAGRLLRQDELWNAFRDIPLELPHEPGEVALIDKVLAREQAALALLESSSRKTQVRWGIDPDTPSIVQNLPGLNTAQGSASLLAHAALRAHRNNQDQAALEYVRQMLALGRVVDRQAVIVSHLVTAGINAMASDVVMQIAPDLRVGSGGATREQVKKLASELLDDEPAKRGMLDALRRERLMIRQVTQSLLDGTLTAPRSPRVPRPSRLGAFMREPLIRKDEEFVIEVISTYINAHVRGDDWWVFQAALGSAHVAEHVVAQNSSEHPVAILLHGLRRVHVHRFRERMYVRAAAMSLGVRLYAVEHEGKLPASASELVPAYLPAVPPDPFSRGREPFRLRITGPTPIVYSVGEDGEDDGGSDALLEPTHHRTGRPSPWDTKDAVFPLVRPARIKLPTPDR